MDNDNDEQNSPDLKGRIIFLPKKLKSELSDMWLFNAMLTLFFILFIAFIVWRAVVNCSC